jgi:hypothetical protein
MARFLSIKSSLAAISAAVLLAACGGSSNPTTIVPVKVLGVAATGLALANKPFSVQCALPEGSAAQTGTTDSEGRYSVTMGPGSAGPCIVTITDGAKQLQSITPNNPPSGTSLVANVTPFSDLIVKALVSQSGATDATGLISGNTIPQDLGSVMDEIVTAVRNDLITKLVADSGLTPAEALAVVDATMPVGTDLLSDSTFTPATVPNQADASPLDKLLDVLAGNPVTIPGVDDAVLDKVSTNPPAALQPEDITTAIADVEFSNETGTPIEVTGSVTGGGTQ